ncbi:MAG: MFS transporter, partial [Betaproteobacteria bacterium]
ADLGLSSALVFGLFSVALIVSAATGPVAGAAIDRLGGRGVLMAASLIFAAALMLMAQSSSALGLAAGWMLLGLGMGAGLYEGAFATLVQLYGMQSRRPITAITLIAGLASTVCWPVTAWLLATLGWRETCMVWAGVHVLINLPLYAGLRKPVAQTDAAQPRARPPDLPIAPLVQGAESITPGPIAQGPATPALARRISVLLALSFALTWFISTALAAHLPQLLEAQGLSPPLALAFAALVGVAQVGGRLLEFVLQRQISSLQSARLAAALHPIGATAFLLLGRQRCSPFCTGRATGS